MTHVDKKQKHPKTAMVIVAHPDDAEFLCGGTVAKLVQSGWKVYYMLTTSGDMGTKDPKMTREKLGKMREKEQSAACDVLGVKRSHLPPLPRRLRRRHGGDARPDRPRAAAPEAAHRDHLESLPHHPSPTATTGSPARPPSTPSSRSPATPSPTRSTSGRASRRTA